MHSHLTKSQIRSFLSNESGAVTVDWTVLAAAVVGLGIATVGAVRTGTNDLAGDINTALSGASVAVMGELGAGIAIPYEFTREMLVRTERWHQLWLEAFRNLSDEDLLAGYASRAGNYASQLESSGATPLVGVKLDQLASFSEVIRERDLDIPEGSPTIQELDTRYRSML